MMSGDYGAVIVDEPTAVAHYAHPDDNRIVVLSHPIEFQILEKCGFTDTSAVLAGRFLCIEQVFCKSCGYLYEIRTLGSSKTVFGCVPPILTAVAVGIAIAIIRSNIGEGLFAASLALFPSWILIYWLVGIFVRVRYPDRAREFRIRRGCPKCGDRRISRGGTISCPNCRQRSMKVKEVGMG